MSYAIGTSVSVERSQAEIVQMLQRAQASQHLLGGDSARGEGWVVFSLAQRQIRLAVPLPRLSDIQVTRKPSRGTREDAARRRLNQRSRERWRAMVLLIKAKLEAVELGITTVEKEFLADIYLPGRRRVGEAIAPALVAAYEHGAQPVALLGPGAAA